MNHIYNKLANDAWIDVPDGQGYCGKVFSKEKFAELIVRECLSIVEPTEDSGDEWCVTLKGTAQEIKEHFGVEE